MTNEPYVTPSNQRFPKASRILKSQDFRHVYEHGARFGSPLFTAFCLFRAEPPGLTARLGFTTPRALGKAAKRNRVKRRVRELLRLRLASLDARWDIVVNPRRAALEASPEEIRREVERLVLKCGRR